MVYIATFENKQPQAISSRAQNPFRATGYRKLRFPNEARSAQSILRALHPLACGTYQVD